jgi:nucleoid-associated protein YgaU
MQRNETLSELAARYFGTSLRYDLILKANPEIKNPARIRAGTRILIPEIKKDGSVAAAGAASDHDADRARRTTDARGDATPRLRAYVVRNGDTLISIARRELGDSRLWKRLYDLNQRVIGAKPELLRAGMTLQLPPVGHTIPLD